MTKKGTTLPSRKVLAIFIGFLAFQLFFFNFDKTNFGIISPPTFGTLGFFLTILTADIINFIAFRKHSDSRNFKLAVAASTISIVIAFSSLFRASFIDRFLLSFLSSSWWAISFYLLVLPTETFGSFTEIFLIPLRLLGTLSSSTGKLSSLISQASIESKGFGKYIAKTGIGLAITIPAAAILLALLSSADPIFGYYVKKIFTFNFSVSALVGQFLWRLFFSLTFLFFIGIFVYTKVKNAFASPATNLDSRNRHLLGPYLMLTTTLSVILILFLIIQFKYLAINNLRDLTEFGIPTFSEYVRKGFIELILTTAIVYTVSGVGLVLYRRFKPGKLHLAVNSTLIILNIVLAAMAYRRVYLYMLEHGLTHMRIYGTMLLLVLVLFLLTLFFRYFVKNHKLYLAELFGASLIVFSFGIVNTDYLLARIAPPTVNRQVDFNYLSRLSADDVDSWIKVYEDAQKNTYLLEKGGLSLDEKILILRTYWAVNEIYASSGILSHKYGYENDNANFVDYTQFTREYNIFDYNFKEYFAYLYLKDETDFHKLRRLKDAYEAKSRSINVNNQIPYDVYQFMN